MYLAAKVLVSSIDELFSATAEYRFCNERKMMMNKHNKNLKYMYLL